LILKPITLDNVKRETLDLLTEVSDSPQREAEMLVERATGLTRTQQLLAPETTVTTAQYQALQALRERRRSGEPLAYVLGECGFWSLQLSASPAVLVPRPETELVVERALEYLSSSQQSMQVLDLGTGSGAIALAIASERPAVQVVATDCSPQALEVARANAQRCGIGNVQFVLSDWFEAVPAGPYALIAGNPPYIAEDDPHVEPSVRKYEPHLALFSGRSGLEAIATIVHSAPRFLTSGGWLVLEHGWQQAAQVRGLLESTGFSSVASHADLAGHERVTEGQWL